MNGLGVFIMVNLWFAKNARYVIFGSINRWLSLGQLQTISTEKNVCRKAVNCKGLTILWKPKIKLFIHRGKAVKMDTGVNMGTPSKVTIRDT